MGLDYTSWLHKQTYIPWRKKEKKRKKKERKKSELGEQSYTYSPVETKYVIITINKFTITIWNINLRARFRQLAIDEQASLNIVPYPLGK